MRPRRHDRPLHRAAGGWRHGVAWLPIVPGSLLVLVKRATSMIGPRERGSRQPGVRDILPLTESQRSARSCEDARLLLRTRFAFKHAQLAGTRHCMVQ